MTQKVTQTPPLDPLSNLLGYQLRRASLIIMNDLHARLEEIGISPAMASALMVIEANSGIKLIDIGYCLDIKRANMTPIITKLEDKGLIKRTIDGRSHALELSTTGVDTTCRVRQLMNENERQCFGHLDKENQKKMMSLLTSIRLESINEEAIL